MTDRILITGVEATGRHGVLPQEKIQPQRFVVDLVLGVDLHWAGKSDDLRDTVSYADVAASVVGIIEGGTVDLIETLAARLADAALEHDAVEYVEVTVHKPQAPVGVPFSDVGVSIRRERARPVVIALGANLGDARATLAEAVRDLADLDGLRVGAVSELFETDPVGGPPGQPVYLNAVALGVSRLHPRSLLRSLHEIEAGHRRERTIRWGARTLDLDLIQVGDPARDTDLILEDAVIQLPHPRARERSFVLHPWHEVDSAATLRVDGAVVPVVDLLAEAGGDTGMRPGPEWASPTLVSVVGTLDRRAGGR